MKSKKIFIIGLLFISFFLTGCDNYKDESYGEQIINSWFNYSYDDVDLGKTRRKLEQIKEIESTSCTFITKYKSNYIYKCNLYLLSCFNFPIVPSPPPFPSCRSCRRSLHGLHAGFTRHKKTAPKGGQSVVDFASKF